MKPTLLCRLPEPEVGLVLIQVAKVPVGPGGSFETIQVTEVEAVAEVVETAQQVGPESSSSAAAVVAAAVSVEAVLGPAFQTGSPVDD